MMHGNTKLVLVSGSGPITLSYKQYVKSGRLHVETRTSFHNHFLIPDEHLSDAAQHYAGSSSLSLENLAGIALAIARAYSFIHTNPKCIYIHGSVGAGKLMLMDTFYQTCNTGFANDVVQYEI
jgi:predicted ATPase